MILIRLLIVIGVLLGFGLLVMYNNRVLTWLESTKRGSNERFYRLVGIRLMRINKRVERVSSINKHSKTYKISNYFKGIIENLDMNKDKVTPTGLLTFISCLSISLALILVILMDAFMLLIPATLAIFYLTVVVFKFMSLVRFEKREAEIMDAVDLLVSDVKGGVQNAITRYKYSFHANIRPYFLEFLDDIKNKGYSFKSAMLNLNEKLGFTFTDFAQKAIMYEEKADRDMDDIFSSLIEVNRFKRQLRDINNKEFNSLRTEFLLSVLVIVGYGLFSINTDAFIAYFFLKSFFGRLLIIIDVVIVAWVLAYITSIKAKSL